jgi:hypothetical protein
MTALWIALWSASAHATDVASWVDAVRSADAGDADAFERVVSDALVDLADQDGSKRLDAPDELTAVPCDLWAVVDARVRAAYGGGAVATYGLTKRTRYSGDRLGIAEELRVEADAAVARCVPDELGAVIAGLDDVGSSAWDARVRQLLLRDADMDASGALSALEVGRVSCSAWLVMDAGVRQRWRRGLRDVYGFSASQPAWLGFALGVDAEARRDADTHLSRCGLATLEEAPAVEAVQPVPMTELADAIDAVPAGGTAGWDDGVRRLMLASVDIDQSGEVDTALELGEIGCDVWETLDDRIRDRWPAGFAVTYGLATDETYLGHVLGLSARMRMPVLDAVHRCGVLDGPRPEVPDEPELAPHDADGSGLVDEPGELAAMTCPNWRRVARNVARVRQATLPSILRAAEPRVLETLGLAPELADLAMSRFVDCADAPGGDLDALAADIAALEEGGSPEWDASVRDLLLDHFDLDISNNLESLTEVRAIPCGVWASIDVAVREGWHAGLADVYGFRQGLIWVGAVIGLDESMRSAGLHALKTCELVDADDRGAVDPAAAEGVDLLSAVEARPGTERWQAVMRAEVLSYDLDASGTVDRRTEVAEVPCDLWQALDSGSREGWGQPLAEAFGFTRAKDFEGEVLAIGKGARRHVLKALEQCP